MHWFYVYGPDKTISYVNLEFYNPYQQRYYILWSVPKGYPDVQSKNSATVIEAKSYFYL